MSLGAGGGAAGGGAESGEALTKQRFLDSWSDALTNTRCHSACMALADVDGMGEVKLLAASEDKKLRVFAGAFTVTRVARVRGLGSPSKPGGTACRQ